jgi:hypothetical protein
MRCFAMRQRVFELLRDGLGQKASLSERGFASYLPRSIALCKNEASHIPAPHILFFVVDVKVGIRTLWSRLNQWNVSKTVKSDKTPLSYASVLLTCSTNAPSRMRIYLMY